MTVLEIGPATVRVISGPGGPVDPRLAEAALRWIDDPVGLYDERPVAVCDLWRSVMATAVSGDSVVLVHPDDWTGHRIGRVVAAANSVADKVRAVPRRQWDCLEGGGERGALPGRPEPRRRVRVVLAAVAAGLVAAGLVAAGLVALAAVAAITVRPPAVQTVLEGRIAVQVPADWTVTRVTGGPGSRRLQVTAPADPDLALHFTQSYAPESTAPGSTAPESTAPESTLDRAGGVLARVIAVQPAGVFVDLDLDGRVAGRPAVTYREVRPGRIVDWSVVLAGSTLIGIGCQSPPQRSAELSQTCRQAVASVVESGTDPF